MSPGKSSQGNPVYNDNAGNITRSLEIVGPNFGNGHPVLCHDWTG